MKKSIPEKKIKLKDGLFLTIYPIGSHAGIFEIDDTEAEEFGEAPVQILESKRYEYEFSEKEYQIEQKDNVFIPSNNKSISRGIIAPGNYVGTLELIITNETERIKYHLEVLATKFDVDNDYDKSYRENYRSMISDITEKCTELLMQSNSPVNQYFEQDFSKNNKVLYQKFSFVKSVLNNEEFDESMLKIFSSPKTNWIQKEEVVDIRSIKRFSNKNVKEILKGTNRMPIPRGHRLNIQNKLESIPVKIESYKQEASLDNPENRFIKHALQLFLQFCTSCNSAFEENSRDQKEAQHLVQKLENYLNYSFFNEISRPTTLKLNSPTLQRKGGYRQQLKFWLMFDLASKLTWTGGEDVYEAGKRDIATLYEYWLFFVLYDLFKSKFNFTGLTHDEESYDHLLEKTNNGLNLIIKSGKHTALEGTTVIKNRALNINFSFNRTFSGHKNSYPEAGSWTTAMRPDYTLTVWPKELKEKEAEIKEEIVHIHFDAKYKVNHFTVKTNKSKAKLSKEEEEEELTKIKKQERKGVFKNADLLKMHAYKDAIRRTGGAYILYPGTTQSRFKGFHELIPGLGAFSVNPDNEKEDVQDLSEFIDEVVIHLVNRASQRGNIASKTYNITKGDELDPFNESIPEYLDTEKEIKLIPSETFVLVGYCKSDDHLTWIKDNLLYNFRMNSNRGALKLNQETLSAKYLLLHMNRDENSSRLYKIKHPEYEVTNRKALKRLGYPLSHHSLSQQSYLVIQLEICSDKEFKQVSWNFKDLSNYKQGRASAIPFTASLPDLMKVKVNN
jgi:predicted component of viral defense system (DUF524 family)